MDGVLLAATRAPRKEGGAARHVWARIGEEEGSRGAEGENAGRFISTDCAAEAGAGARWGQVAKLAGANGDRNDIAGCRVCVFKRLQLRSRASAAAAAVLKRAVSCHNAANACRLVQLSNVRATRAHVHAPPHVSRPAAGTQPKAAVQQTSSTEGIPSYLTTNEMPSAQRAASLSKVT